MPAFGKPSPAEPVTLLRKVPIIECGEKLVPYLGTHERIIQAKPRWKYERAALARESVVKFLHKAADALPQGYKLAVIEGWRPPHIQHRMWLGAFLRWKTRHPEYSDAALRRITNRFTAPLHYKVPPPHSTGGAVDVMLANDQNEELDMVSPFAVRDRKAYPADARGLSETAALHRKILREALAAGGLTNYPSEYWHWSYGDQGWAYRGGHDAAVYGPIQPENWSPNPSEMIEEPLEFLL